MINLNTNLNHNYYYYKSIYHLQTQFIKNTKQLMMLNYGQITKVGCGLPRLPYNDTALSTHL